jgi:hypothetical protein
MMRSLLISLAAFGALAACGQHTPPATTETPAVETPASPVVASPNNAAEATAQDTCGAAAFQHLVGTPASGVDQATLPAGARIITPTSMVTQDFNATRLNVITDSNGNVSSLSCY